MIKIILEIDEEESAFEFNKISNDWEIWKGEDELGLFGESVLIELGGENGHKQTITVSPRVTTPTPVIYDRFYEKYLDYMDQLKAGLEPTAEIDAKGIVIPYDPDQIKVRKETFSVFEINRMMTEQKDIDLNPDFQRNLVWDNARRSALIESILLGIPIPVFYFSENKSGIYYVVDGLQRLSTLQHFLNNGFVLTKLEHLIECEGRYYKRDDKKAKDEQKFLERKYSRRLENAQLVVYVIESTSPDKVKYDIFKRINTGGRPLNHQEVRNCVAENSVRKYLKELASSEEFLQATGKSVSDNRMDAQELVLRFTGFNMEREGLISYNGDMNSFLNSVLDNLNKFSHEKLEEYKDAFIRSMRKNYYLFGDYCFRKCLTEHLKPKARKQFINKALFVTWSIEVLNVNERLLKKNVKLGEFAYELARKLDDRGKYFDILTTGTSDKQNLKDAAEYAKKLLIDNNLL